MPVKTDDRRPGLTQRLIVVVILLAFAVPAAWAISLYDIIQLTKKGYRDDQIVAIIEATGSRFEVDSETIVTLKQEGVREKVIQAVIAASDGPPARDQEGQQAPRAANDDRWRTQPAPERDTDTDHAAPHDERTARRELTVTSAAPAATSRISFSAFPFEETGAGHHQHYVIGLGDIPIIVLRSEAGFPTVGDRAHATAEALNRAATEGLSLTALHHGVVARTAAGATSEVLKVGRGDVIALQRRSAGRVVAERVASYWAAILSDYMDVASGREPRRLTAFGIESVQALYRELVRGSQQSSPSGPVSPDRIAAAIDRLPGDDRQALIELAGYVPTQFRSAEETR